MKETFVDYTTTARYEEKYDWFTNEIIDYVRNARSEEDAVYNLNKIMDEYKKRKRVGKNAVWGIIIVVVTIIFAFVGLYFSIFYISKAQAVEMTAHIEPNICNSNIDILKQCCK